VADQLEFQSPVRSADFTQGQLTLVDLTATSSQTLVRGNDSGLTPSFGHASRRDDGALVAATRPDEWTLIGPLGDAAAIASSVPSEGLVTVIDQTHSRARFRLSGDDAVNGLEKVCSVDLGDHMTPNGAVFSASVAKVTCDVIRDDVNSTRSYLLICDRSFGDYVFGALADASTEFGLR